MNVLVNGNVVREVITNRSLTVEEALYAIGYDVNDPEDLEKAYNDDFPAAYLDDCGNYQIDTDLIELDY